MWFNPAEITKIAKPPVATLATLATFQSESNAEYQKVAEVAEVATPNDSKIAPLQSETGNQTDEPKTGKPETLQDRQREARRQRVIAMLETSPDTMRAIYADTDSDLHNVILTVAVRHPTGATCEMTIDKATYDPWKLLKLVERHGQETH